MSENRVSRGNAVEDLKPIIAKNITHLRQASKMTQSELAERLNYSDKAVSKWERAESLPDITVLKAIADQFSVPLDHLVREDSGGVSVCLERKGSVPDRDRNHAIITTLSILLVWFVATLVYVMIDVLTKDISVHWITFLYAVPASMIVWLVFNSIWFNTRRNYLIVSLLTWSGLLCVVLTLFAFHIYTWQILLLGIPGQIIIVLWSKLQYGERR